MGVVQCLNHDVDDIYLYADGENMVIRLIC